MTNPGSEALSAEARLALAYCPHTTRQQFEIVLGLDARLARIVARTSEMMLGQMRLAWWREVLAEAPASRPQGDAVLDAISRDWHHGPEALIALVDGWEYLLGDPPLPQSAAIGFAQGRAGALMAAAGCPPDHGAARNAGMAWALGDLAAKVSNDEERCVLVKSGQEWLAPNSAAKGKLAPEAAGLAVLGALGKRSLDRGGRPLMEGRMAALVAIRAAIFRR